MRKRLLAVLMITAMITAFGPIELFAGTENYDAPLDTGEDIVTETTEDGGEDVVTETTEPTRGETDEVGDGDTPEGETTEPEFQGISKLENIEATPTDKTVDLSWTVKEGENLAEGETLTIWNGSELVGEITDINQTSITIGGLERITEYTFVFKVGDRVVSEDVTFTTTTTAIELEKLSSYKCVYLRWGKVEGANYYVLKYQGNGHEFDDEPLYEGAYKDEVKHSGDFWMYDTYTTSNNGYYMRDSYLYRIEAYDTEGGTLIGEGSVRGDAVKTLYYELTFKNAATLTSHSGGSKKYTFKKGQKVYARDFDGGRFIFDYQDPKDGKIRTYYTLKIRVNAAIWSKHIYSAYSYTGEEATRYVNDRGLTSNTKHLIWVNPYTQKDYIFTGSKGKWKLVTGPLLVSTGQPSKPTATGSTNISTKKKSQHGIPTWNMCRYFSLHGKRSSWVLGWPRSGACVRHYNSNAKWIYDNCKLKTRVYVY